MFRRPTILVALAPFSIVLVVLLLADRAPAYSLALLDRMRHASSRLQEVIGVDIVDRTGLPIAFEEAGHFLLWFVAAVLSTLLVAGRFRFAIVLIALLSVSIGFEVGQRFLTATRSPSVSDAIANAAGVGAGLAAVTTGMSILTWTQRGLPDEQGPGVKS